MNPSFRIVLAFKNSRVRSSRLGGGRLNKRGKVVLALATRSFGTDSFELTVHKEARGDIKEDRDSSQSSGDSHNGKIIDSPFNAATVAQKKDFTAAKKTAYRSKRGATVAIVKPAYFLKRKDPRKVGPF